MIKKYWEITLRDYDIMEKTGNVYQFRSKWNILPSFLFKKKISKLIQILIEKLNDSSGTEIDEKYENAIWQLESLNSINSIHANYMGLMNELKYKLEINSLKRFYQKYTWKRLKLSKNNNAKQYIKGIKELTGIEVKKYKDINKVRKLLEFKKDKYNENFQYTENQEQKRIYLMGFALGVFSKLSGIVFNPNQITVIEFIEARNEVLKMKPVTQKNK